MRSQIDILAAILSLLPVDNVRNVRHMDGHGQSGRNCNGDCNMTNAPNLAPNLDCVDASELMPFWNRHKRGKNYRELFPNGGKGTKRATADLANYASNKHAAMFCRRNGDVTSALMYENICDRIYDALPDFAQW
jgi:hypothetical protein